MIESVVVYANVAAYGVTGSHVEQLLVLRSALAP